MDCRYNLKNQRGSSLLILVLGVVAICLIIEGSLLTQHINLQKNYVASLTVENRNHLVYNLGEYLSQDIALRFSRYSNNIELEQCLKGIPQPCDESKVYDMVLYAPIMQQSFQGGIWPDPPVGALLIAGGLQKNLALYQTTGARCPLGDKTKADQFCSLQGIVQFKPLCGGTSEVPEISVAGGKVCAAGATGFDITIGVARFLNDSLIYHKNTSAGGDARTYRFPAKTFTN